jgi:hypothetical protein
MSFLAPYMLWGAAAASIPIALHFLFRSRYRRVPWAAMSFLLTSIEQTSRRLKFQELLLLAVRVLVLVLLALAFARPLLSSGGSSGPGDPVDAVLILDTSYSMDARDGAATRLDRAKTAALEVLDHLPPMSNVHLITSDDRAEMLGPQTSTNIDQARKIVGELRVSHRAGDLLPAVRLAETTLQQAHAPNKEVYLFSDMQKLGWEQQSDAVLAQWKEVARQASVYLVRCGTRTSRNAAVVGISSQSGIPHTGERVGFAVLVRNTGKEPLSNLTVTLKVGEAKEEEPQMLAKLEPGETRAVTLTGKLSRPGLQVISAAVKSDDLDADNRFDRVIQVRDRVRVLVVDGRPAGEREPEKSSSFFLLTALLPVKPADRDNYYLQPYLVTPRLAAPGLLADKDLCVLTNVAVEAESGRDAESLSPEFVEALSGFVRKGRGLLIFAGENVSIPAYNRLLFRQQLLPAELKRLAERPVKDPVYLDRKSITSESYWNFREDEFYKSVNDVQVWRSFDVNEPDRAADKPGDGMQVLMRYTNGKPAVLRRGVEAGEVVFVTTAADPGSGEPGWTDWPLHPSYLPFVDVTVNHLLHRQTQKYNYKAGDVLEWRPSERVALKPLAVEYPDGRSEPLDAPRLEGGWPVLSVADTSRAGVYRIKAATGEQRDSPVVPFAVVPDLRDSADLESFTDRQLDEKLGISVRHRTAGDGVLTGEERLNREYTPWLLIVVLVLAVGEALLAWFCGRAW